MSDLPPPLTTLEEQLDALLVAEIERQDARRQTRGEQMASRMKQSQEDAAAFLARSNALRNLILALERLAQENWSGEMDGDTWVAYEAAREALGAPIQTFPGGNYDHHIHWLDHEEGTCRWCDAEDDDAATD